MSRDFEVVDLFPLIAGMLLLVMLTVMGVIISCALEKKRKKKAANNSQINLGTGNPNRTAPPSTTFSLADGTNENTGFQTPSAASTKIAAGEADMFCAKCGKPFFPDDVFCGDCGARRRS